jgi:hypothetical protein
MQEEIEDIDSDEGSLDDYPLMVEKPKPNPKVPGLSLKGIGGVPMVGAMNMGKLEEAPKEKEVPKGFAINMPPAKEEKQVPKGFALNMPALK